MAKRLLYGILACLAFSSIIVFAYQRISRRHRPADIILWDLHDVVLKRHGTFKTIMRYPHKAKALQKGALRGGMVKLLVKNMFKEGSSEEYIHLARKHNNPYMEELIIQATNAQRPISGTAAIIQELSDNGYEQHVGSNIGRTTFDAIINPEKHPDCAWVFRHFDINKSHVVDFNNGAIVKKPNPEFFQKYLDKNKINLKKTRVIFIDDKKKNIETARSLGFHAIQFKNPDQLRQDLAQSGVTISVRCA